MAFLLVPLATVKQALRVDTTDDDVILTLMTSAASRRIVRYLKGEAGDLLGIDSPPDSPPNDLTAVQEDIALAVIMLVGYLYKEPDGDEANAFNQGFLPSKVIGLIYDLRVPTLA